MPAPDDQQMPVVSTEAQRQALDDMSRQLLERLNEMVREQHERVERFAATQHSLSALPGQPQPAEPEPQQAPAPAEPVPAPAEKKRRIFSPLLPPRPTEPRMPQEFAPLPEDDGQADWLKPQPGATERPRAEESGCGSVPTVVLIVILVIILRACT